MMDMTNFAHCTITGFCHRNPEKQRFQISHMYVGKDLISPWGKSEIKTAITWCR